MDSLSRKGVTVELWVLAEEVQHDRGQWEPAEPCYSVIGVYLTSEDANRAISRMLTMNATQDSLGTLRITVAPRTFLLSRTTLNGDPEALTAALSASQLNPGSIEWVPYDIPF